MSCSTSIHYGYGFPINKVTPDIYKRFWKNHKGSELKGKTEDSIQSYIMDNYHEYYECKSSGNEGIGSMISNIMAEETGIRFEFQPSMQECDADVPIIMFSEAMPWWLTEKEKTLTEQSLKDIMEPYMSELGIPLDEFGQTKVEYYG